MINLHTFAPLCLEQEKCRAGEDKKESVRKKFSLPKSTGNKLPIMQLSIHELVSILA